ncbi:MAG: AmmeMemoRadiSam system protein B, partial [Planctomycetota bacterium]
ALIVASSDMNHFESEAVAKRKDGLALERARELDAAGMLEVVEREDVSMCGAAPAAAMLFAAKELGAREAEVVAYGTSADATGDTTRVVGYAAVVVREPDSV